MVAWLLSGRFWLIKCLVLLVFCALFFTCVPVFLQPKPELPPAYELKSHHPFADTSQLTIPPQEGERLHGHKLTYRIFGSILLWITAKLSLHPYLPSFLGGCFLLLSALLLGNKLTKDRLTGLLLGLMYAGLYAISACLSVNHAPKPFDGVALGLIGMAAAMIDRPYLLFLFSLSGCWTDERSIFAILYIVLLVQASGLFDLRGRVVRFVALFSSILAYLVTRLVVAAIFDWSIWDRGDIGMSSIRQALPYSGWAVWTSFEGGWILVAVSLWSLWKRKKPVWIASFLGLLFLSLASAFVLFDTSRAVSFSFPLIAVGLALLKAHGYRLDRLQELTAAGAIITLLAPNFEVIAGVMLKWLPPTSMWLLNRLL